MCVVCICLIVVSFNIWLQEEYDELLKYAVVVPTIEAGSLPKILHEAKGSLLHDLIGEINPPQLNRQGSARRQPTDGAESDGDGMP